MNGLIFRMSLGALLLVLTANVLQAGERSVRFRAGTILSAEVSNIKPEVQNESAFEPYKDMKDVVWAEVVVHLDKGRTLGVADYSLYRNENEYKCVAIAESDKDYDFKDHVLDKINMFSAYRLLFPVQVPASEKTPEFELRFKLLSSPMPDVPLKFRNMGANPLTDVGKISPEGALGLPPPEPPQPPAKKPAPAAAAPAPAAAPAKK